MLTKLEPGVSEERTLVVGNEHTAARWGSGSLRVLATPHMIALMEASAVQAVDHRLQEGYATVGSRVDIRHLAPTPVGAQVTARAELVEVDGLKLTFRVEAHDGAGEIGSGIHERHIIDVARFLTKADARR